MAATMTTSAPTYALLRIRFIENDRDSESDAYIAAAPIYNPNTTYTSTFNQEYKLISKVDTQKFVSKVVGGTNLVNYIANVLRLVSGDDKPCKRVQIELPNVPTILVNHGRIRNRIPEVVDMLRQIVESWPTLGTELPAPQPTFPFANINWNATATPFVPQSPPPVTIPAPPFNWNSPSFRTPVRVNRHMYFDDAGNELIDLTMDTDTDTDSVYDESQD